MEGWAQGGTFPFATVSGQCPQGDIVIAADFGTLSLRQPQCLAIRSQHNPPAHIFMHNAAHLLRITFDLFFSFSYLITTCLHHPIFTY